MNLVDAVKDYIEGMIVGWPGPGRKALIVDKETLLILSMVYSRTQILQKEVFFIDTIENIPTEKLMHLKAVFFCRCTEKNVKLICEQLKDPVFSGYYLYFSSTVERSVINQLAEADSQSLNVIQQVQEVYADFQAVNTDLFNLDIPQSKCLPIMVNPQTHWTINDKQIQSRIVDGIYGVLMSTRSHPLIRYDGSSPLCKSIAQSIQSKIGVEQPNQVTLLIFDRKEDPITPLLNQWTYQSMIHELLTIQNNRVSLKDKGLEEPEIVISQYDDDFFKNIMFRNYGEVAEEIQKHVQSYLLKKQSNAKFTSIEDMQKLIENFPEFKQGERNCTKHFNLIEAIRTETQERNLYAVSELEQDMCQTQSDDKNSYFTRVKLLVEDPKINRPEKLKLVLLFCLRYENDPMCQQLKQALNRVGQDEDLQIIKQMLDYAGQSKRTGELFQKSNFFKKSKQLMSSVFMQEPDQNVFLQTRPYLSTILEQLQKGGLSNQLYPSTQPFDFKAPSQKIIVFIVGGATFAEAKEINALKNVILGSTTILTSKSFIQGVSQLSELKMAMQNLEIDFK